MKKTIIAVVCIFSCMPDLFAQNENSVRGDLAPPDTFPVYKIASVQFIPTLNSFGGHIIDTLDNPTAFLIDTLGDDPANYWCIAVKKPGGFIVFDPFENIEINAKSIAAKVSRKQVDGKGSDELIIEWSQQMSHHSAGNGFDAEEAGITIINLDNLTRLMYYQAMLGVSSWSNSEEPDTTDPSADPVVVTVEDNKYEKYLVSITDKCIVIQQECLSPGANKQNEESQVADCDKTVYKYRLEKKGFIRKK